MNWDNFAEFYDWEFDLFCSEQQKDVKMWLELAKEIGGPILELACGSGRITIPLAESGFNVTALDNSEKMLNLLRERSKHLDNISTINSDMVKFNFEKQFKFVFVSYSSFQQILDQDNQIKCLRNIFNHLESNGILALDIGTHICSGVPEMELAHQYTAEFPKDDSTVSMFTSYKTDTAKLIRHWEDTYVRIKKNGERDQYINKISLKECDFSYMNSLLEETGFKLLNTFGSFEKQKLTSNSDNAIYICRKIEIN